MVHINNIKKSKYIVGSILNIFDTAADIKGNDKARPTPAPVNIAPIKNRSKMILKIPDCFLRRIPEKVNGALLFLSKDNAKATVGKMYSAHPVNIQWNRG